MDIVKRNFLRLLRIGALDVDSEIEPMSVFKWNRLLATGKAHHVEDYIRAGIQKSNALEKVIPQECMQRSTSANDYSTDESQPPRLHNVFLNKLLTSIREKEIHAIDTSVETLTLLNLIIDNCNSLLSTGISLRKLLKLGKYLREKGDKVDFVKLDAWLQKLQLQRIAQFEGNLIVLLFDFEQDEIPFVLKLDEHVKVYALRALQDTNVNENNEWCFKQGRSGFLKNNPKMMMHTFQRGLRFFYYAPIESVSSLIARFAASLSEIEE